MLGFWGDERLRGIYWECGGGALVVPWVSGRLSLGLGSTLLSKRSHALRQRRWIGEVRSILQGYFTLLLVLLLVLVLVVLGLACLLLYSCIVK